jgi:hypothetical protein
LNKILTVLWEIQMKFIRGMFLLVIYSIFDEEVRWNLLEECSFWVFIRWGSRMKFIRGTFLLGIYSVRKTGSTIILVPNARSNNGYLNRRQVGRDSTLPFFFFWEKLYISSEKGGLLVVISASSILFVKWDNLKSWKRRWL